MLKLANAEFDWDTANVDKCQKHGLSRSEIEQFFLGDIQIIYDLKHSKIEQRLIAVGFGPKGRPIFVVFALRKFGVKSRVRPISARFMHTKEASKYEKTSPKI